MLKPQNLAANTYRIFKQVFYGRAVSELFYNSKTVMVNAADGKEIDSFLSKGVNE